MTELSATSPRRGARTFRAACIVLATVAAAQAATSAFTSRPVERAEAAKAARPPEPPRGNDPFSKSYAADDPHPEMQTPAGEPPPNDPALEKLKPVVPAAIKRAAPLDVAIKDEEVLAHIDEGLLLKGKGDMQGALSHFRAALKKMPDHPKLLYHTARTLDTMGLPQKAALFWKSLYLLGQGTGDFYIFARERMAEGSPVVNEPDEEKEGKFTIKDLTEEALPDNAAGERVRLTVVVKKNTPDNVDLGKDMLLVTHFFDSVNEKRIARSQVDQPVVTCLSTPIDWAGGTETFSFDYWQPAMTPEQLMKFGRCKYFGCALDIFYKDKLQDSSGTIGDLVRMAHTLPRPAPEPGDSLLDSTPGGQEPSLFPPVLKP